MRDVLWFIGPLWRTGSGVLCFDGGGGGIRLSEHCKVTLFSSLTPLLCIRAEELTVLINRAPAQGS